MKTINEKFHVGHGFRDDHDQKLEPEEQPVDRVILSKAAATHGDQPLDQSLPVRVTSQIDTQEMIAVLTTQCRFCTHWRQDEWQKDRSKIASVDLDRMRAQALDWDNAAVLTEHDRQLADPLLDQLGKCMVLSLIHAPEPIYSHPEAGCPECMPDGSESPSYFKAREGAARMMQQARDRILRLAQGRNE